MTRLDFAKPLVDGRSAAARAMAARPHLDGLGEFLKEQRHGAQLTLRQLAEQAGVSNPYLSQIERGLRRPSAEVLQQLARALRISAEALYVRAGFLESAGSGERAVEVAVTGDPALSERHKRLLLDLYHSLKDDSVMGAEAPDRPDTSAPPTTPAHPSASEAVQPANTKRRRRPPHQRAAPAHPQAERTSR